MVTSILLCLSYAFDGLLFFKGVATGFSRGDRVLAGLAAL